MTLLETILSFTLFGMYVVCRFTVCSMTSAKERPVLDPGGLFRPFRWLIGAALPAPPGLRFATQAAHVRR